MSEGDDRPREEMGACSDESREWSNEGQTTPEKRALISDVCVSYDIIRLRMAWAQLEVIVIVAGADCGLGGSPSTTILYTVFSIY